MDLRNRIGLYGSIFKGHTHYDQLPSRLAIGTAIARSSVFDFPST